MSLIPSLGRQATGSLWVPGQLELHSPVSNKQTRCHMGWISWCCVMVWMWTGPWMAVCLDTWSWLVVLFGKVVGPLGDEVLLEEVSHWGLALKFDSMASFPIYSLLSDCWYNVSSLLILWRYLPGLLFCLLCHDRTIIGSLGKPHVGCHKFPGKLVSPFGLLALKECKNRLRRKL